MLALLLPTSAEAGDLSGPLGGGVALLAVVGLVGVAVFVGLPLYLMPNAMPVGPGRTA